MREMTRDGGSRSWSDMFSRGKQGDITREYRQSVTVEKRPDNKSSPRASRRDTASWHLYFSQIRTILDFSFPELLKEQTCILSH